jgi:hypothetical protein
MTVGRGIPDRPQHAPGHCAWCLAPGLGAALGTRGALSILQELRARQRRRCHSGRHARRQADRERDRLALQAGSKLPPIPPSSSLCPDAVGGSAHRSAHVEQWTQASGVLNGACSQRHAAEARHDGLGAVVAAAQQGSNPASTNQPPAATPSCKLYSTVPYRTKFVEYVTESPDSRSECEIRILSMRPSAARSNFENLKSRIVNTKLQYGMRFLGGTAITHLLVNCRGKMSTCRPARKLPPPTAPPPTKGAAAWTPKGRPHAAQGGGRGEERGPALLQCGQQRGKEGEIHFHRQRSQTNACMPLAHLLHAPTHAPTQ